MKVHPIDHAKQRHLSIDKTPALPSKSASIYDFQHYRDFIRSEMGRNQSQKNRGKIKDLSVALACHPTYVSQVLADKAHFSIEQALGFCHYVKLNEEESEFFLNLLNRDRAGNQMTRNHYHRLIQNHLKKRQILKNRFQKTQSRPLSSLEFATQSSTYLQGALNYYETWIPQAIHMICQVERFRTPIAIAQALQLPIQKVNHVLKALEAIGLVKTKSGQIEVIVDSIHLDKKSPFHARYLGHWRIKTIEDLNTLKDPNALNYTSLFTASEQTLQEIREMIVKHLATVRDKIAPSPSEQLCVYNLDFYKLTE